MPYEIRVTGLQNEADVPGHSLIRVRFQLSEAPDPDWAALFSKLSRELALLQNHGVRPGFRFSYQLDADTVQVNCTAASFNTVIRGKSAVVQAVMELVADVNSSMNEAAMSPPDTVAQEAGLPTASDAELAKVTK